MPRPICVKCKLAMQCTKNDFPVRDPVVGDLPSTYWLGDKFSCPECGVEIVTGFGEGLMNIKLLGEPIAEMMKQGALEFRYE